MRELIEFDQMTVEDYLRAEENSQVRHEYVNGYVFEMSGATEAHNLVCGNLFSALHAALRGSSCRAYVTDMKVHAEASNSFYYPDIMVTCEPFDARSVYKSNPIVLVEVLSPSTAQIDRREKLVAYGAIASLREYCLVYQDRKRFELFRRSADDSWSHTVGAQGEDLLFQSLPCGTFRLPMDLIYEGYSPLRVEEDDEVYAIKS